MRGTSVLLLVVVLATLTGASGAAPEVEETTPVAVAPAEPYEDLNLGFEAADRPEGWFAGGDGYVAVIDKTEKHAGERSLRIAFEKEGQFGVATGRFPLGDARGKQLRLAGHIKTDKITRGWAGLWMRVDGPDGVLAFDNMQQRGITGTTDWTRYEIVLDVPEEAININFGALLAGDGVAWVDTLSFEIGEPAGPPPSVTFRGIVEDPDGNRVAGAHVALVGPTSDRAQARARSGKDGRFAVEAPAGDYAVTATARGLAAAFDKTSRLDEDSPDLTVRVGGEGFTVSGRVTDEAGDAVTRATVRIFRISDDTGDIFYTETDDEGRYEIKLIPGDGFMVLLESKEHVAEPRSVEGGADRTADIGVVRRGPASADVVAWFKKHAIPLKTPEAGHGFDDMEPLREIVGDARVVALGEATHGTREFFQLKHRMLEFLVEEMGFTVFAIEANWPESLAINDYVLDGKGDAKEALAGIYFWTWNTEEVLELIEWMRRYNADPEHDNKIKFYGFDMQTPTVAAREAVAYLGKLDPEYAKQLDALLDPLAERGPERYQALSEDEREALAKGIDDALKRLDARRDAYVERTGDRDWVLSRQQVVILKQAVRMYAGQGGGGFGARDEAMADNIKWILETEPPGTRVVAWAHNGHVSLDGESGMNPMGSHLAGALGDDYVVFGFAFNEGSFQAMDWTQGRGKPGGLREHTVGPSPEGNIGAAFARTGLPIFVLDLRRAVEGETAGRWFGAPHPMRAIGAVFSGEDSMSFPIVLTRHYDSVIFVDKTTRARPVERE